MITAELRKSSNGWQVTVWDKEAMIYEKVEGERKRGLKKHIRLQYDFTGTFHHIKERKAK